MTGCIIILINTRARDPKNNWRNIVATHDSEDQALLQSQPSNMKLALKLYVWQACTAAELDPICLPQYELSAAVAGCISEQLER